MYIIGTETISKSAAAKKKENKKAVGGFSDLVSSSEAEEAHTSGTSGVSNLSQLLFLQEVDEEEHQKKEAVQKGFDVLKYLDSIRTGLLTGTVSKNTLMGLDALLQKFRKNFTDPNLTQILDEIELRAKVEIAKLESN